MVSVLLAHLFQISIHRSVHLVNPAGGQEPIPVKGPFL